MTDTAAAPQAPKKTTVTVTIDGKSIEANPGELLIAAAERTGTYIPRFCWHPRMREVGMCRMCLVNVSGPRGMALQPSCMLPVADGMVVDTKSDTVRKAQEGILEFLLVNHPLDCPVCDKGGECPLQDQTLAYGPGESRFVEEKRHNEKPIAVSDLVVLDRERCILCDRCTRFSKDVAGDPLIHFINRGNATEVNTFPNDPFASYFSGNVVQICPVGALTAKPYRFSARPWDLDQVESTCTVCGVGCKIVLQSSGDKITRTQGVDSQPVNWGWLCDKGRFSFEAVSSPTRLRVPQLRASKDGALVEASWADAIASVAKKLRSYAPAEIAFIGGAQLTNEDQYAWAKLAKAVLRTDNTDAQLADGLPGDAWLGLPAATIDEASNASVLIVVGADVKETLPVLYLRLRDAIVNRRVPLIEIAPMATGLTKQARVALRHRAGEEVAATTALLAALDGKVVERQIAGIEPDVLNAAAAVLAGAIEAPTGNGKIVVVFGPASLSDAPGAVVETCTHLADRLPDAGFLPAIRRANTRGALEMGLAPGMLPGRVRSADAALWYAAHWPGLPEATGLSTAAILEGAALGSLKALVLLGVDPSDIPDAALVERALAGADYVVAVDTHTTTWNAKADVVLPACGAGEKAGTVTNIEGRITRVAAKVSAPGVARPDWAIAAMIAEELGEDFGFSSSADVLDEIGRVAPLHIGLDHEYLAERERADGVVLPLPGEHSAEVPPPVRLTARVQAPVPTPDAYSLRLLTAPVLFDQGVRVQASPSLAPLARPVGVHLHPGEVERHGLIAGAEVRVLSQTAEVRLAVVVDERVPRGVAFLPFGDDAAVLVDLATAAKEGITKVRLESVGS